MNIIEYIIQKYPEYKGLYIDSIVLCKKDYSVIVNLSSKIVYTNDQKSQIESIIYSIIPKSFNVKEINYSKIYCDNDLAQKHIKYILNNNYPSLNSAITKIECKKEKENFSVCIELYDNIKNYVNNNNFRNDIKNLLYKKFKENFSIDLNFIKNTIVPKNDNKTNNVIVECEPDYERKIEVNNTVALIGKVIDTPAKYIADCEQEGKVIICGKVNNFTNKQTKNGKVLIYFYLKDFTGIIPCIMFPSSANLAKINKITDDSEIILQGELQNDNYRNALVCNVRYISYCELPENFVLKKKKSKPVPLNYNVVKPQLLELTSQVNIFDKSDVNVSEFFKDKKFVVFDIETTGLNYDMDKITEIGAILIDNGKLTHSFSTLINPETHIREETVKLNGIDDELVKNSPLIKDVIPDFYKFSNGCYLVAQNIDFDLRFIRFNAKKYGYYFENCFYDTLEIARKKLANNGLSNYKLDTLCDYFNIDLKDHHRAWNDAMATAKLFIKLINLKN